MRACRCPVTYPVISCIFNSDAHKTGRGTLAIACYLLGCKNTMDSCYLQKFFITGGTENSFNAGRTMQNWLRSIHITLMQTRAVLEHDLCSLQSTGVKLWNWDLRDATMPSCSRHHQELCYMTTLQSRLTLVKLVKFFLGPEKIFLVLLEWLSFTRPLAAACNFLSHSLVLCYIK